MTRFFMTCLAVVLCLALSEGYTVPYRELSIKDVFLNAVSFVGLVLQVFFTHLCLQVKVF